MTEQEFWELIHGVGGLAGFLDGGQENLVAALAARSPGDLEDFADHLAGVLFRLDRADLARQPAKDSAERHRPVEMSADTFLYARCAVVLAGRERYLEVLADPAAFRDFTDVVSQHADGLLEVAPEAYEEATGDEWSHVEPFDYETGSNKEGWARRP
ncbi:DUF4240 domain-containing protein [Dactylosporangium sp. NPDC000555]|uniref:DUF4240 domain-containing protein n=1 Tax=Dactylosporangium sp. NPDC000555 TaxID=3154260 RepID=UPI003327EEE1